MKNLHTNNSKGFSLVELAIVIAVISALLVGLLFSRDIIENARMTAINSKLVKIYDNVKLFKQEYGYLPGDMPWSVCDRLDSVKLMCGSSQPTSGRNIYLSPSTNRTNMQSFLPTMENDAKNFGYLGTGFITTCMQSIGAVRILARVGMLSDVPDYNSNEELSADGVKLSCASKSSFFLPKGPMGSRFGIGTFVSTDTPKSDVYYGGPTGANLAPFTSNTYAGRISVFAVSGVDVDVTTNLTNWFYPTNGPFDPQFANRFDAKFDDANMKTGDFIGNTDACFDNTPSKNDRKKWCALIYIPAE